LIEFCWNSILHILQFVHYMSNIIHITICIPHFSIIPFVLKWLSIIPKIDVQKWLSTISNLAFQRHNLWNSQYVEVIVSIIWRHNSWNNQCQFYEDTIHEITSFSYTSCSKRIWIQAIFTKSSSGTKIR